MALKLESDSYWKQDALSFLNLIGGTYDTRIGPLPDESKQYLLITARSRRS